MVNIPASRRLFAAHLFKNIASVRAKRSFVTRTRLATGTFHAIVTRPTFQQRFATTNSPVDAIIEDIQEQYATAKDEFEIAQEETEKMTVYAEEDREAAREELDKLQEMYNKALQGSNGQEIKQRIGQRIRELDNAVKAMEELAQNQD